VNVSRALLTVTEVAALLAVRPALVREIAHRGEMAHMRIGRKLLRFRPDDVEKYIASRLMPARSRGRGVA
jgi:excisionase family DNA binding protein